MALKPGQIQCINTLDASLVVAAGAGSGKTFTLTKRIVHALESGFVQDIDQILAITYTKKAAGELKSRIKSSLAAAGMMEQALKVDEAWISTIHGMCARILRAHAIELGIDPKFEVGEAAVLNEYLSDAVNQAIQDMELEHPAQLASLFEAFPAESVGFGASVSGMVRDIVSRAGAAYEGVDALRIPSNKVDVARCLIQVRDCAEQLRALVETQKQSNRQAAALAQLDQAIERIAEVLDGAGRSHGVNDGGACWSTETGDLLPSAALDLMEGIPASYGFGNAEFKAQVKELVVRMQEDAMRVRLFDSRAHLETLVALAKRAFALFTQRKRREGVFDNNDLLVLATRAVVQHDDIAARYKDKFAIIMVDEFQDTDQMQIDMIKRLAGEGAARLCTVGDAQQSIYRFRGADVSVYRRHLNDVARSNPHNVIKLPDNFRSHADVLSFVDRVFERNSMFGGEFMSLGCSRAEEHVAHPFKGGPTRIIVQHTSYEKRGGTQHMREVAAQRIAQQFAAYARAGHNASDMVLLLGVMSNAALYAQAIRDQGLACVIAGGSVLSSSAEALMMKSLVRFLANPHQTQDLFTVLSSPLFGLEASDFIELATTYGQSNGRMHRRTLDEGLRALSQLCREEGYDAALSPRLAHAHAVLRVALGQVGRTPIATLAKDIVRESGLLSRLQMQAGEGQASAANIFKLLRILDDAERSHSLGPSTLAEHFEHTLEVSTEAPGALSATGGNFVRIMTVHASKGLEFPIVAVAEMKGERGDASHLLVDPIGDAVYLSLEGSSSAKERAGVAGASFSVLDATDESLDEDDLARLIEQADDALEQRVFMRARAMRGDWEETKRLLYVALTRAKEAIIVSSIGNASKNNHNGAPANMFKSIGPALTGSDDWFDVGVSQFDFGGSAQARVEHVRIQEDGSLVGCADVAQKSEDSLASDVVRDGDEAFDALQSADLIAGGACGQSLFMVPAMSADAPRPASVFRPSDRDVFSYSSVSEASHDSPLLDRLARAYGKGCVGVPKNNGDLSLGRSLGNSYAETSSRRYSALIPEEDEASWAYLDREATDTDKATDLGTAFHRLAEYAVHVRQGASALRMPPEERVAALARTCGLGRERKARLEQALKRWFASDLANSMARLERLYAEVPFFVGVQSDADAVHLEGEIDLLGFNSDGAAFVVDYKTGGNENENEEQLLRKHVLQATCYAYALLRQGCPRVEASFVRVEKASCDNPEHPQVVRYRFDSECLDSLEQAVARAYQQAREG